MDGVISVRRVDEDVRPLIAPGAAYFLRTNLALQLQAARLALLRNEQAVFQQSLDDASAWLEEFYDPESSRVTGALATIAEIRDGLFDVDAPDISQSLRQLRQYSRLSGSDSQERAPVEEALPEPPADEATVQDADEETSETL